MKQYHYKRVKAGGHISIALNRFLTMIVILIAAAGFFANAGWAGRFEARLPRTQQIVPSDQIVLPLHFSFCLTTLKKETCGRTAKGSIRPERRIVTTVPNSIGLGLRPSTVR